MGVSTLGLQTVLVLWLVLQLLTAPKDADIPGLFQVLQQIAAPVAR